jgi:hypothetical protein
VSCEWFWHGKRLLCCATGELMTCPPSVRLEYRSIPGGGRAPYVLLTSLKAPAACLSDLCPSPSVPIAVLAGLALHQTHDQQPNMTQSASAAAINHSSTLWSTLRRTFLAMVSCVVGVGVVYARLTGDILYWIGTTGPCGEGCGWDGLECVPRGGL